MCIWKITTEQYLVGRRYEWHGLLTSTYRLMYLLTSDSMTLTTAMPTDRVMVMVMIKKKAMWMVGSDMGMDDEAV